MAVWALRDGESAAIGRAEIDHHVATCAGCRAALAEIERLDRDLSRVDYERLDVDLWPAIQPAIAPATRPEQTDRWALSGLIVVLIGWRACQLLLDLPAPVVNSIVPLACVFFVLWRLVGDPFAIHPSSHQFRQESAS
jgi:predicted anti-sigma-YlaC factor YlaD